MVKNEIQKIPRGPEIKVEIDRLNSQDVMVIRNDKNGEKTIFG